MEVTGRAAGNGSVGMYEVSCVAGNKVDAAYAVKSLSNVIPPGMGHTVSVQRHHAHSQSYKHKQPELPPPVSKPDALKSHVMRLLKRSKSHTPATRAAENQSDPRNFDRRTVFARPVVDEQRRRRNSAERRRSGDKRVMVTIVDGLPVVVTGQNQVPQPPSHPPPVTPHHRHSHKVSFRIDVKIIESSGFINRFPDVFLISYTKMI